MDTLQIGDKVACQSNIDPGKSAWCEIYAFFKRNHQIHAEYLHVSTNSTTLRISGDHIIFTQHHPEGIPAGEVEAGDMIWILIDKQKRSLELQSVQKISRHMEYGVF